MNTQPFSRINDDYELVYQEQDVRGWPVRDLGGHLIGRVQDFIVDTDRERVTSLVLDGGTLCSVKDITIGDGVVLLLDGSSRTSLPDPLAASPGPQAPAPAPPSALTAVPSVRRSRDLRDVMEAQQSLASPPGSGLDSQRTPVPGGERPIGVSADGALHVPVIEEEIRVSKREVQRGGVRLTAHLAERPVEEQVTLKEEHVHVERRPIDRPVDPVSAPFERRSLDVVEKAEEAVVAKQARVVEEIVVDKETNVRTEQIRDTVRRTEVDVQPLPAFDFSPYEAHYQQTFASSGLPFDRFAPAYRFGHELRSDSRLDGQSWQTLEPTARTAWEKRSPGTWERFKDAIYHAWARR